MRPPPASQGLLSIIFGEVIRTKIQILRRCVAQACRNDCLHNRHRNLIARNSFIPATHTVDELVVIDFNNDKGYAVHVKFIASAQRSHRSASVTIKHFRSVRKTLPLVDAESR